MHFSTPDLCDAYPDEVQVVTGLLWQHFGGRRTFGGPIQTVKCFEDNSRVKDALSEPGHGRVLVVDGGGSLRHALIGDQIASKGAEQGWSGVIIHGACRDVALRAEIDFGVLALGAVPVKSLRRGEGQLGVPVSFGRVLFKPGDWVYADANGIISASRRLV